MADPAAITVHQTGQADHLWERADRHRGQADLPQESEVLRRAEIHWARRLSGH